MQTHPKEFPPDRRNDPKRRAEARIFDALQRSGLPGFVYYEWQRDRRSSQLDDGLWLIGVGRFGLQAKGGQYLLENGQWYLRTGNRLEMKESPLRKTFDATMSLHDEIFDTLGYEAFFIAVLVFPDMEPDQAIVAEAKRSNVHVIWGVDGLVDRLREIADVTGVYYPPNEEDIAREVAAVSDGQVIYGPPAAAPPRQDENPLAPEVEPESRMEIAAGSITIQHVDTLNVYTASAWDPDAGGAPGIDRLPDKVDSAGE